MSPGAIITVSEGYLELAKYLLGKGFKVVIVGNEGEVGPRELGRDVLWLQSDVAEWDQQVEVFGKAFEWCQEIELLVVDAGIVNHEMASHDLISVEKDGPQQPIIPAIGTSLIGAIYNTKLFLYHVRKQNPSPPTQRRPKARIIMMGSENDGSPYDPIYAANKAGLMGLTHTLGPSYLHLHGITINFLEQSNKLASSLFTLRSFDFLLSSIQSGQVLRPSKANVQVEKQRDILNESLQWVEEEAAFWAGALGNVNGVNGKY